MEHPEQLPPETRRRGEKLSSEDLGQRGRNPRLISIGVQVTPIGSRMFHVEHQKIDGDGFLVFTILAPAARDRRIGHRNTLKRRGYRCRLGRFLEASFHFYHPGSRQQHSGMTSWNVDRILPGERFDQGFCLMHLGSADHERQATAGFDKSCGRGQR